MKKAVGKGRVSKTKQQLLSELDRLKHRLSESEDTLEAIRTGAVDALVVSDKQGEKIFTLQSVDTGYRVMVESMNEGAAILDNNGIIVFANNAFSVLAGREMAALVGARFGDILPGPLRAGFSSFLRECAVRPGRREFLIALAQGGIAPVSISGTHFKVDGKQNVCLIISDLQERKDAEQELRNAYGGMERKVVERTMELQKVNDDIKLRAYELARANKELQIFSESICHDLRNPLSIITTNTEVLSMEVGAEPGTSAHTAMTNIIQSVDRIVQVINDLLTLSGITRQDIQFQEVDLSEMVRGILSELKASDPGREAEIHIQPGLTVNADPGLLRIMMDNFIRNAWKFTSKRKMARIELGTVDKDGKRCYFLRDNGAGYDMKKSARMFIPYVRLHSAQDFKGSGIGLAIAKRIVEKHNGAIWAEGEKDIGATFYFRLA